MYRISKILIGFFMTFGLLLCLVWVGALKEGASFTIIITLIFPFSFIGYAIYLWRKRIENKGFYWDDEGVVIDLNGNKVYWDEIESIKYSNVKSMKSTVVYPHYTNHEKIRIRRKKLMPTPAHSIDWILIEKPKEFHKNLMNAWEEKQEQKTLN